MLAEADLSSGAADPSLAATLKQTASVCLRLTFRLFSKLPEKFLSLTLVTGCLAWTTPAFPSSPPSIFLSLLALTADSFSLPAVCYFLFQLHRFIFSLFCSRLHIQLIDPSVSHSNPPTPSQNIQGDETAHRLRRTIEKTVSWNLKFRAQRFTLSHW